MTTTPDKPQMRAVRGGDTEAINEHALFIKYRPEIRRAGCFGCVVQCMDVYPEYAKGGGAISCGLYSVPLSTGTTDVDVVLESSLLSQRYGIDVASSMQIINWLMELYEKGVITAADTDGIPMEKGSREAIVSMLNKMAHREGFGNVLADGMLPAAEKIGRGAKNYANQVKGLPMYENSTCDSLIPAKAMALCTVISSRGDTMRARTKALQEGGEAEWISVLYRDELKDAQKANEYLEAARQKIKEITGTEKAFLYDGYEGTPELAIYSEDIIIINDCLSTCKVCSTFVSFPFTEKYQAALFSSGTGVETDVDELFKFAKTVRNLERAYCVREGMTRETDSLPKRYMDRPVGQGYYKGSVLESTKFEEMKSKYYALRGWDVTTGIPTRKTLEKTGLTDIAEDLKIRGIVV